MAVLHLIYPRVAKAEQKPDEIVRDCTVWQVDDAWTRLCAGQLAEYRVRAENVD
jgi:hypothetical protein